MPRVVGLPRAFGLFGRSSSAVHVHVETAPPMRIGAQRGSIVFAVDRRNGAGADSYSFVVPRSIDEVGTPPSVYPSAWRSWAYGMGGVDAPITNVRVTLQGDSSAPVLIDSIKARILRRERQARGVLIKGAISGCGGIEPRQLWIRLGDRPPTTQTLGKGLPYTLSRGEFGVFDIYGVASAAHVPNAAPATYSWVLDVHMISGARSRTVTVTDGGQPFRTSSAIGTPEYAWYAKDEFSTSGHHFLWHRTQPPC
jgi:hypothetical protein